MNAYSPGQITQVGLQGPPGPLAASVATLAALAALPPSGIPWPQGTPAFSQASGGTSWAWYPTGATPPAGATTTAGNGGLWVQQPSGPATLTAPTPAALSALAPGSPYPSGTSAQVAAPFGRYTLVPTYAGPYDVCHVQASSAAGGGAWVLASFIAGSVPATEIGADSTGVSDSSAAFQAALTALAGTGVSLFVPAGTYQIASPVTLPSNIAIFGLPGQSIIRGTITPDGIQAHSIFFAQNTTGGTSSTLASNATVGRNQVSVTANLGGNLVVGNIINITSVALRALNFVITAVTGTGPYTVTLDRPVRDAYTSGSTVIWVPTRPTNIIIDGLTFTGTATRLIEIVSGYKCEGRNLVLDGSSMSTPADILASFDIAGQQCVWRNVKANMAGNTMTSGALALESNENSHFIDCYVSNATATSQTGFAHYDCFDCTAQNCEAVNCYAGFQNTADGNTNGSDGTVYRDCRAFGGTFAAFYNASGSTNTTYEGCTGRYFTDYQLLLDVNVVGTTWIGGELGNASGANALAYISSGAAETKFVGARMIGASSTSFGWQLAGSGDVQIVDCTVSGSLGTMLSVTNASADVDISGLRCTATVGTAILTQSAGAVRARGLSFAAAGGGANLVALTGGRLDLEQCRFAVAGSGNVLCTTNAAGLINVQYTVITGANNALVTEPGTINVGPGCDFTGAGALLFQSGGTITQAQGQGEYTDASVSGTVTLSHVQAQANVVKATGTLTANITYNVPKGLRGAEYTFVNATSGAFTATLGATSGTGVAVAQGKSACVWSDGANMNRASPDT